MEKYFKHYKEYETFLSEKDLIKDTDIVFILDLRKIYTHGEEYKTVTWNRLKSKIYYTTSDGNIINVHDYWKTAEDGKYWPIENYYDKKKDLGYMVFEEPLTEIPGIEGAPMFYSQKNLLTLKLPKTITKIGRGAFWDCSNLEYINFVDLVNIEVIEQDWCNFTKLTEIDLRNSKLISLETGVFYNNLKTIDYILLPNTIKNVNAQAFNNYNDTSSRIKTLMIPTLSNVGSAYIENQITENLIINKFDGLGDLHYFNTDCIIWVPDEFYDEYIEKYTNNTNVENWQDIVSRLRKYSEGVPEFPIK